MSSAWPPELKAWVAESLGKATPSNKSTVHSELKQIVAQAFASGTLNSTDWKSIELKSLKSQAARTTYVPPTPVLSSPVASYQPRAQSRPPPLAQPGQISFGPISFSPRPSIPAPVPQPVQNAFSSAGPSVPVLGTSSDPVGATTASQIAAFRASNGYTAAKPVPMQTYVASSFANGANSAPLGQKKSRDESEDGDADTQNGKKKKKKKNKEGSVSFPSPYHFASDAVDSDALARRAMRFAKSSLSASSGPVASPRGVTEWFDGNGEDKENDSPLPLANGYNAPLTSGGLMGRLKRGMAVGRGAAAASGVGLDGMDSLEVDPNVIDWDRFTIRGTSTRLEKAYLRLTSEPSPADIRPLPVLKQTLELLKRKWRENHDYKYALDQFKSVRQDLTVQRIKNEFTVEVYEIHARIALEAKDLGEYNQCQTMLRQLYELSLPGHPLEFLAYRILYLLHTRNQSDMASLLSSLSASEKADPHVSHSLNVHKAMVERDYVRLFRLYAQVPGMGGYLMDWFVDRERVRALGIMSRAYMTLPLAYIAKSLAFDDDNGDDGTGKANGPAKAAHEWLESKQAAVYAADKDEEERLARERQSQIQQGRKGWKRIEKPKEVEWGKKVWDCRKAVGAVREAMGKAGVLEGQQKAG